MPKRASAVLMICIDMVYLYPSAAACTYIRQTGFHTSPFSDHSNNYPCVRKTHNNHVN